MATFFIYAIALLVAVPVLLRLYNYSSRANATKKAPPSPPTWPIIGNLHQLSPLVHRSFFSLAQQYGRDLMLLHLGTLPSLVVSSAEAAREILQTHDVNFSDKPTTEAFRKLSFNYKEVTMAPFGEYWRQARRLLVYHCLTQKQVQNFIGVRDEETANSIKEIEKCAARNEPVNLSELLLNHMNNVSTMVTFGRRYNEGESGRQFKKTIKDYVVEVVRFRFEDTIPGLAFLDHITGAVHRSNAAMKALDTFLESTLEERRAIIKSQETKNLEFGEPLIDVLLKNKKSDEVDFTVDREGIKALLADMYLGGTLTTSSTMQFTMGELLANPAILKRLQSEIRAIVKDKNHITNDELDQMEFLRAVIMESTRIHPPSPLLPPRIASEDVNVMGYDIAKGTRVYVNAWAVARDPKVWHRPEAFLPERFLGDSTNYVKHDFKLLSFGAGRRGCPGRLFAMFIAEHLIASMLCKFDFLLPDGAEVDLTETVGVNHPKLPILAFPKPCP